MTTDPFLTSGDIARILDAKVQAVRHILHTRTHIVPVGRAGIVKIYDAAAIAAVAQELRRQEETAPAGG